MTKEQVYEELICERNRENAIKYYNMTVKDAITKYCKTTGYDANEVTCMHTDN